jgi:hypothetical protein
MPNIIEIKVRATDETATTYDAAKARAAAAGAEIGDAYASGMASKVRSQADRDAEEAAAYWSSLFAREAEQEAGDAGMSAAEAFKKEYAAEIAEAASWPKLTQYQMDQANGPDNKVRSPFSSKAGMEEAEQLRRDFEAGLLEEGPPDVMLPNGKWASEMKGSAGIVGTAVAEEFARQMEAGERDKAQGLADAYNDMIKTSTSGGQRAAKDAGAQTGGLLLAGIVAASSVAAPLLLAGFGTAFTGIAALALKNNVVIKQDFTNIASVAEKSITAAAAPLAGTMHQALLGVEGTVTKLTPELQGLFVNAEPDITSVASGVENFASSILPGMSSALKNSQVIVADFGDSLGTLGSGAGNMLNNMTRDAYTTGAGMKSLLGTVSNLASTLGSVLGSAASVGSTALLGLDPVLNTTLTLIQKISSPGTVGAGLGAFAAFKFDPAIATSLKSAAGGLSTYAKGAVDAEGATTLLGRAASGMSGALGKAASIAGGPWGIAIGAGVGLAVGLAGALINAAHASDALTLSQQGLQQAVAQDNGEMGKSTSAYVASQAQADGLAKSAAAAGVSLQTWTQAVLGNTDAQKQVTDAVMTSNQSTLNQQVITDGAAKSTGKFSDEQRDAQTAVAGTSSATNRLTDQNKQLLASMQAQHQQIVDAINKQTQLQQATNALTNSTGIFAASLKSAYQAQVASSQQSALTSIASLNLGDANVQLSQSLYNTVDAYTLAQTGGNSYLGVLDALSGSVNGLLGTEAAYTTSLSNLTKVVKGHTDSLDVNTAAGAANITKITAIATSADKAAAAVYQNEVQTKGSTKAFNDANDTLATMKQRFIDAADKAGYDKDQVKKLADQLFQLPKDISIPISADTSPAYNSLGRLLNTINSSSASVSVRVSGPAQASYATGGNISAAATGGARGNLVKVGERGTEFVRLPYGSTVIPHSNVQSMEASSAAGRGGGGGGFELSVAPGSDSAVATMINKLARLGLLQIKQKAIVP